MTVVQTFRKRVASIFTLLTSLTFVAVAAGGCGSRGPLDDGAYGSAPWQGDASTADVRPQDDSAAPLDGSGRPDATPIQEAIACATCLQSKCGATFGACIADPACQSTVQCLLSQCLGGGSLDVACALGCAKGDPKQLLTVLAAATCPSQQCGKECPTLVATLGGLGGPGGGGPGGGGPGGGGPGGGGPR
jgi:hypothetical protein